MDVKVKVLISDEHWAKIKERIPVNVDDKKREVWFFESTGVVAQTAGGCAPCPCEPEEEEGRIDRQVASLGFPLRSRARCVGATARFQGRD